MQTINDELLELIAKHQLAIDWDSGDMSEEFITDDNIQNEHKCLTVTSEISGVTYSLRYTDTEQGRREALNQLLLDSDQFPDMLTDIEVEPHFADDPVERLIDQENE